MPHRTMNIVFAALGLAGLVVIAVLAIWGADIRRAARSGPKWKRKTVAAGLLLLAMMGFGGCGGGADEEPEPQAAAVRDADKRKKAIAEAWRGLDAAWEHGTDYAFGRHGLWPFDKAAKDAVLKRTDQFDAHVAVLERFGEIRAIEADALKLEWDFVQEQIDLLPAADLRKGYPRSEAYRRRKLARADKLLGPLTALVNADSVNQEVVDLIRTRALELLDWLEYPTDLTSHRLEEQSRTAADKLLGICQKLSSRTDLKTGGLDKRAAWVDVCDVFNTDLDDTLFSIWDSSNLLDAIDEKGSEYDYDDMVGRKAKLCKGIDKLVKNGVLCTLERNVLNCLLSLPDRDEYESRFGDYRDYWEQKEKQRLKWFGQVGQHKSMPRVLHGVLVSVIEARVDLACEGGMGLNMLASRGSILSDHHPFSEVKPMRQVLARMRRMSLEDSDELSASDGWRKIESAHRLAATIAGRLWFMSRLDQRSLIESFEPLDKSISTLVKQGLLSQAEAGLLQEHREFILDGADDHWHGSFLAMVDGGACGRISRRMGLLGKIAKLDRLNWRVSDYVLIAVEADIGELGSLEPGSLTQVRNDTSRERARFDFGSWVDEPQGVWTDSKGRTHQVEDFDPSTLIDEHGRPKSILDKMTAIREDAKKLLTQVRDKQRIEGDELAHTDEWRGLTEAWKDAQELTTWGIQEAVWNRFGIQRLAGRLKNAVWDIENLRRAELLSGAEAAILTGDMEQFLLAIDYRRTWEQPVSTCYDGGMPAFPLYGGRESTLGKRTVLFQKLADSRKLKPEVVARVLYVLKKEVLINKSWVDYEEADPDVRREGIEDYKLLAGLSAKIRKRTRVADATLAGSAEWSRIVEVISHAAGVVSTGTNVRKRKEIQDKLQQASMDVYLLYAQGMLTREESGIIDKEIANARRRLVYSPPTDFAGGLYMNPISRMYRRHPCDTVLNRVSVYSFENMFDGKTPGPEILKVMALSLETDIRILDARPLPYCCNEHEPEDFVEQTAKLKAMLAKVRKELTARQ
jgi:hypothetical protein